VAFFADQATVCNGTDNITNLVVFPVLVKVLETIGRETNGGGTGKAQTARVKELKESILKDFGETKQGR
jgi:hypothetical protein